MKILVVEDEPSLNQIIAKRLKIEGYSVDQAENGRDAWSLWRWPNTTCSSWTSLCPKWMV
mgnify:CR=1 FL=1